MQALDDPLAGEPAGLAALRVKRASQRPGAPLYGVPGYTRALQGLFDAMRQRHCLGLPPRAIGASRHSWLG